MFGFGSSTSDSSSSSTSSIPPASTPTEAPNREQRAQCWQHRDAYFECLDKNGQVEVGKDGICNPERGAYEKACGKSWIEYFNKRRVLEMRQKATVEAAARARETNPANAGR